MVTRKTAPYPFVVGFPGIGVSRQRAGQVLCAGAAIGSGILNVMRGSSLAVWADHVRSTIELLSKAGRRGFGFNMLSLNSDPERRRADLYYADPPAILADCIARYGRHVALLQDYCLWEFTMLVRQQSSQTASPNPVAP